MSVPGAHNEQLLRVNMERWGRVNENQSWGILTKHIILRSPQSTSWSLFGKRWVISTALSCSLVLPSHIYEWTFCWFQEVSVHLLDGEVMEGLWYSHVLRLGKVMMEKRLAVRWKLIYRYDVSEVLLQRLNQGSHASPTFFPGKLAISKYLCRFDIIYIPFKSLES